MAAHIQGQDWSEVTLRKTHTQRVQMAAAAGTSTDKPANAGMAKFQKLDHATEAEKLVTSAPLDLRVRIAQARAAKGMTQSKLAQALNLRAQDIQAYEAGKAKPDGATLSKMSRVLGTKLTGKAAVKPAVVKPAAKKGSRAA